ncbi:DegV family protein [Spiroplasma platyhelix]|uniref:DegV family protein n=1 Tax=Spiroplasma platyhelix PALS-1 TaxID=1276218 RepID=A0A846TZY1_9MOLU|nr:DegV family protein [Spiroplasma platyhelix]MBE4703793.1 Fatty acid-binding protein [Spiroplasma platyhelix PALS-1]NKE38166.1 DegV family protein [Spiroplasma platyhelix PALS-1]UJB29051.1 fatty acid-binding protein DegV [Spiroplasma platyhelix PALS-1]
MKKKIGIITDSSTGLSLEEIEKYSDLIVVPLVIINEDNQVYEDNHFDINSEKIYQAMIKEDKFLKTSQTNREKLRQFWIQALKEYDEVLFLPIAQAASGQYDSAVVLQKEPEFANKVVVYETGAASVPLKAMALIALKLAKENHSMKEIIKALDEFRITYECFLTPDNLSFLVRGGRIPSSLANIANFLRLKAIIACKEKIKNQKIKRTMSSAIKEMLELIIERTKNSFEQTLYVINGWCDQSLIDKAVATARELGFKKIKIEPLCNILQTHTGDNTIGFSVVANKWNIEV